MTGRSITPRILVAVGTCVSFAAAFWLLSFTARPADTVPALICAFAVLVVCWAALLSDVARARHWSPRTRHLAGLSIAAPLVALFLFIAPPRSGVFDLVCMVPVITGFLCRKMAYPQLTEEEATAPEPPLSLFHR
ncbi:MAG: hypothetical protein WA581_19820 [Candidatus Acidiferrales bacterium]